MGLKDNEEIRAVASPPADENAVPVKDFGELKVVKERIFTDVAKSVCPRKCYSYHLITIRRLLKHL